MYVLADHTKTNASMSTNDHLAPPGMDLETILSVLARHVDERPTHQIFRWVDKHGSVSNSLTYKELWDKSCAVAQLLAENSDIHKGDRVMIVYPFGLGFLSGLIGCMMAGVIACSVYPPNPKKLKTDLPAFNLKVQDAGAKFALTTVAFRRVMGLSNLMGHKVEVTWLPTDGLCSPSNNWRPTGTSSADDVAFIQYTSGSTGFPKGVMISQRSLVHNAHFCSVTCNAMSVSDPDERSKITCVSWMPQYHDMGLIGFFFLTIYSGVRGVVFSPVDFIQNPILWHDMMVKYKARATLGPNFSFGLLTKRLEAQKRPVEQWTFVDRVVCAAEPVDPKVMDQVINVLGVQPSSLHVGYGLAEVGLAVAFSSYHVLDGLVACGDLHEASKKVCIANEAGEEMTDGTIGEVFVQSPSQVALGYWGNPELTASTFARSLSNKEGEWLATGDLGKVVDNKVYITGRSKELIIINGKNVYPHDIERLLESEYPSIIRPGSTVAFQNSNTDVGVALEIRNTVKDLDGISGVFSETSVRRLLGDACGVKVGNISMLRQGSIPKTTSGKLKRLDSRRMSLEASWSAKKLLNNTMADSTCLTLDSSAFLEGQVEVETTIKAVLGEDVSMDSDWDINGLTSLMHAELISSVQEAHQVALPINFQLVHKTPDQLRRFIEANAAQRFPVSLPDFTSKPGDNGGSLSRNALLTLQTIAVFALMTIFALNLLPAYYVGKYTLTFETVIEVGSSRYASWTWLPVVLPTFFITFSLSVILLKWIVIGRYREGVMDMPSRNYFRWWLVDRLVHMWELLVGYYVLDTKLIWLFYRFMGADVSWSCELNGFLREFDLLSVGACSSIEHQMQCRKFKRINGRQTVEFRTIQVGSNCTVEGVVEGGARLADGSQVDRTSAVFAGSLVPSSTIASGSPAYNAGTVDTQVSRARRICAMDAVKVCWLFLELYLFFAMFLLSQVILNQQLPSGWRYSALLYWVLLLLFTSLFSLLSGILMKWILIGRRRADHTKTFYRESVYWICDYHFKVSYMLISTVYPHSRLVFNGVLWLLGMDIDIWSFVLDYVYLPPSKVDLVTIKNSFVSGRVHFESGGEIEIVNSSIGLGVSIGKGVNIHGATVRPQVNVRESVYEDGGGHRPAQFFLKFVSHETACWCVPVLGFVSLIPAFEVFNALVYDERTGVAICGLIPAVVVQLVTWASTMWLVERLAQLRGREMWFPVYINLTGIIPVYGMWFLLWGSSLYGYLLRFMGARVEGELWFFGDCYDFSLLTFEDGTVVDNSIIIGHYAVYDRLVIAPTRIGGIFQPNSYVHAGAVALNGSSPFQVSLGATNMGDEKCVTDGNDLDIDEDEVEYTC